MNEHDINLMFEVSEIPVVVENRQAFSTTFLRKILKATDILNLFRISNLKF